MPSLITPTAGVTYSFTFQPGYEKSDGVYKVVKIMTYEEYLSNGRDILQDFFTPNGKDEVEVMSVIEEIRSSKIIKIIDPDAEDDQDAKYAPVNFLEMTPDHNVKKYYSLGLISMLGITENPADMEAAAAMMVEQFEAVLGVTPEPHFVTVDEKWMTEGQYQEILKERDEAKLKIINYFSENHKLEKRNDELKDRLKAYEEIIIKQDTYIRQLKKQFGVED